MNEIKEYISLIITALSSGGVVYLITYFVRGKKDRVEEQKTVIGYLKARLTRLEKKDKQKDKEIKEIKKKYLDLEIKLELTDFERKIYLNWILEQKNGQEFLDSVKDDVKSKEDFLNRIKKFKSYKMDKNIINTVLILVFALSFLFLFYLGYTYTVDRLAETANLEIELEKLKNQN